MSLHGWFCEQTGTSIRRKAKHCYLHNGMPFCKMHCAILLWLGAQPFLGVDLFVLFADSAFSNVCLSLSYLDFKNPTFRHYLLNPLSGVTTCQIALVHTDV